jgi:hypothetical protein
VADKLTPLILDALARAATTPDGTPLFASKSSAGLFPAVAAAKPAAHKCLQEGLIRMVRTDGQGKQLREFYAGTPTGLKFLVEQSSPKQVLDDFVRLLEERRDEVADLLATAERMAAGIDGMKAAVAAVLATLHASPAVSERGLGEGSVNGCPRPPHHQPLSFKGGEPTPVTTAELCERIHTRLRDWSASPGVARDCPLVELFASLTTLDPAPSVGQFHDALRQLHADARIYLHPWTGPLYALPEPAVALLVGHEIAYYASLR